MKPVKLERDGQPFYDDPIYAELKKENFSEIRLSVSAAFNGGHPELPKRLLLRYQRINLRWMTPDGKGGLVPRDG